MSDLKKTASTLPEPAMKRRRVDDALTINSAPSGDPPQAAAPPARKTDGAADVRPSGAGMDEKSMLEIRDISIVVPQRKKYTLEFTSQHLQARQPDTKELIPGIRYAWADIGT